HDTTSTAKRVWRPGHPAEADPGPTVWGTAGTNGQHAYFQLIHQGTRLVPCDFIGTIEPSHAVGDHHDLLMANFLAQSEALAFGKTAEEVAAEGVAPDLVPHRTFPGNRPTNTILTSPLSPATLGHLAPLYHHRL